MGVFGTVVLIVAISQSPIVGTGAKNLLVIGHATVESGGSCNAKESAYCDSGNANCEGLYRPARGG